MHQSKIEDLYVGYLQECTLWSGLKDTFTDQKSELHNMWTQISNALMHAVITL
jgi:hypothetical protein